MVLISFRKVLFQTFNFGLGEGFEIFFGGDAGAAFRFEFAPGVAGDGSTGFGCLFVLRETLGVFLFGDLRCGSLTEHGGDQLEIGHMITEIILGVGESFEVFVFGGRHAEGGFADLSGKDGEFFLLFDAALFPFAGEFVADGDAAQSLFNPRFGIAFLLVNSPHPFGSEFWVFDLLESLVADLREPAFEGFGFGRWDGLDETKELFGVGRTDRADFAVGSGHFY